MIVPRLFSRLDSQKGEPDASCPLSGFIAEPALVILGEPGMGKTTSFIEGAKEEENAEYLTIRQFLRRNPSDLQGKTLYLDGLDEQRAGKADGNQVIDEIIGKLGKLGRPGFRLSCRTADWYGELDESNLREASSNETITVIRLEPLKEEQILEIVASKNLNGDKFLEDARRSGIEEWVTNPQHLVMVLKVVSRGQAWPETRKELFERACLELAQEHNETHRRAGRSTPIEPMLLLRTAGLICVMILRADLEGMALDQSNATNEFPDLTQFQNANLPLAQAARTKLFRHPAPERATYYHRTMAEYLAALFLAHQMDHGLPAERVRRLLTTKNGIVPSHLRGLHAWVATLCPERFISLFIQTDPLGMVFYGDPASLPVSRKENILDGIVALSEKNPWFRAGHWGSRPLGRLADPALGKWFQAILSDWKNQKSHLLDTILDIIFRGKSPAITRDVLLKFICNPDASSNHRAKAAEAFIAYYQDSLRDLLPVLKEEGEYSKPDDGQRLRAVLLKALYPSCLTPDELFSCLSPVLGDNLGFYDSFLKRELVKLVPSKQLPNFMSALIVFINKKGNSRDTFSVWQSLACETLARAMEQHGERVSIETLYTWLSIGVNNSNIVIFDQIKIEHHASRILNWLNARPEKVKKLFLFWVQHTPVDKLEQDVRQFWVRVQPWQLPPPIWFADWCLDLAANNSDEAVSIALFRIGASCLLRQPPESPYPLDRVFSFIECYPRFQPFLEPYLYYQLRDDDWKMINIRNQNKNSTEDMENKNIEYLSNNLDKIRNAFDIDAIIYLGTIYQGWTIDEDKEATPRERLQIKTSPEIVQAAEEGFVHCVMNYTCPTPEEIGKFSAEKKIYSISSPVLAGMDLIEERLQDFSNVPEATLKSAIAFRLAFHIEDQYPAWFKRIMKDQPELVVNTCQSFWMAQLQAGKDSIGGLYNLARDDFLSGVAHKVAVPILKQCPDLDGDSLRDLLVSALRWGDRQEFHALLLEILNDPKSQVPGWPLWAAADFVLDQCQWSKTYPILVQNQADAAKFLRFVGDITHGDGVNIKGIISRSSLPVSAVRDLVMVYGKLYSPFVSIFGSGWGQSSEETISNHITSMINRIATELSEEATHALQALANYPDISGWHLHIQYTLANHQQQVADNSFDTLSAEKVFRSVMGGIPSTAGDLQALVVDQIRTIARELRDGNTDGYKIFWNLDKHGRTTNPIPEEDGRDRLLEKLRPLLSPLNIHAEPEGHHADDKRSDIKVTYGKWILPIEIKRDKHNQLWQALENQLINQYMRDSVKDGYGIYLVFWFGEHGQGLQKPPGKSGISLPSTPVELEDSLQQTIPPAYRHSVQVVVVDVSTHKPSE
ncbi:MAG: hypothetical protein H7833_19810 [Magnetococcus sp. DMHC-1]